MIPKIIHQIWIGDKKIPDHCQEYIKEIKRLNPEFKHFLWGNEVLEKYKDDVFLKNYLKNPQFYKWAYISDRIRLLILKDIGGVYADVDVKPIKGFNFIFNKLNKNTCFFGGVRREYLKNKNYEAIPPIIEPTVYGASINSRVINEILSIYTNINWAHGGLNISRKIMDVLAEDVILFNYKTFGYCDMHEIDENTVSLHDDTGGRLWSWK